MSIFDNHVVANNENELISHVFAQTAPVRYYVGSQGSPLAYAKTLQGGIELREMARAAYRLAAAGKVYLFQRRSLRDFEYFAIPCNAVPKHLTPKPFDELNEDARPR